MWLMKTGDWTGNDQKLELVNFPGDEVAPYAILSHTWGSEEVTFDDVQNNTASEKIGFKKLRLVNDQAFHDGLEFMWIDSCCIDKSSSAELSEAINSMYAWYERAEVCYAYLEDVHTENFDDSFPSARWWSRGFCLQELLAPTSVIFFSNDWQSLGTKHELKHIIAKITSINAKYLDGSVHIEQASIAKRMSWASCRETTRGEDIAYCLMGIFSVNMPMLYGEGKKKAFLRLQEEIMKTSDDHSLFAWVDLDNPDTSHGLLADHPKHFQYSGSIWAKESLLKTPFSMTNLGLSITLPLSSLTSTCVAALSCPIHGINSQRLGIHLKRINHNQRQYVRTRCDKLATISTMGKPESIYIRQTSVLAENSELSLLEFFELEAKCGKTGNRAYTVRHSVIFHLQNGHSHQHEVFRLPLHLSDKSVFDKAIIFARKRVAGSLDGAFLLHDYRSRPFILLIGSDSRVKVAFDACDGDILPTHSELQQRFAPTSPKKRVTLSYVSVGIRVVEITREEQTFYRISVGIHEQA